MAHLCPGPAPTPRPARLPNPAFTALEPALGTGYRDKAATPKKSLTSRSALGGLSEA